MPHAKFDRSRLIVKPLAERQHDLDLTAILPLDGDVPDMGADAARKFGEVGARIAAARDAGTSVIFMMGAHVLRAGVQRHLIDLMERGSITHIAMNGAGPIHDYEFALIGATTESVARYIRTGEFGLWEETGRINDIAVRAAADGIGLGEAVGREISEGAFPHRDVSVLAAAYRLGVPATVHIGIGYDIIYTHPLANGAGLGRAAHADFRIFVDSILNLEGGVFLSVGSAIMAPQVFEKAMSIANNLRLQEGREVLQPFILVNDLASVDWDWSRGEPPRDNPAYYLRFCKSFSRMGGEMVYAGGDNRVLLTNLLHALEQG